jgi:hypothetical protein
MLIAVRTSNFILGTAGKIVELCLQQAQNNHTPGAIKQQATLPIAKWEFRAVKSLWRTPVTALS